MTGDITVIYRAMSEQDIVLGDELDELARKPGLRLIYAVGDHRAPGAEHLLSTEHLTALVPDISNREVYICGPPAMMEVIKGNVIRAGTLPKYIHAERFAL